MSDQVVSDTEKTKEDSGSNPKEEFVPRSAFVEVSTDMHKYKTRLKETEAKLNEILEKDKLREKEKLEAEKKWEELYKAEKQAREETEKKRDSEHEQWINSHKVNALLQELGGLAKPEYIKHANLKAIEILEDGSIDDKTLKKEVDRFRQEHAVLLKNIKAAKLPDGGPKTIIENSPGPADFNTMRKEIASIVRGEHRR